MYKDGGLRDERPHAIDANTSSFSRHSLTEERVQRLKRIYATNVNTRITSAAARRPPSSVILPPATPNKLGNGVISSGVPAGNLVGRRVHYGRSSSQERIDDLRDQLIDAKRAASKLGRENTMLRTRLQRFMNEAVKRGWNKSPFAPPISHSLLVEAENEAVDEVLEDTPMTLKERLRRSQIEYRKQIEQIKNGIFFTSVSPSATGSKRSAKITKSSDIKALEEEVARLKEALHSVATRADIARDSNSQMKRKFEDMVRKLEKENAALRGKVQEGGNRRESADAQADKDLETWTKPELIALVRRLEKSRLKEPLRAAVADFQASLHAPNTKISLRSNASHQKTVATMAENAALKKEVELLKKRLAESITVKVTGSSVRPHVPKLVMEEQQTDSHENSVGLRDEEEILSAIDDTSDLSEISTTPKGDIIPVEYDPAKMKRHDYEQLAADVINAARATIVRQRWLSIHKHVLDEENEEGEKSERSVSEVPDEAFEPHEEDGAPPNLSEI